MCVCVRGRKKLSIKEVESEEVAEKKTFCCAITKVCSSRFVVTDVMDHHCYFSLTLFEVTET